MQLGGTATRSSSFGAPGSTLTAARPMCRLLLPRPWRRRSVASTTKCASLARRIALIRSQLVATGSVPASSDLHDQVSSLLDAYASRPTETPSVEAPSVSSGDGEARGTIGATGDDDALDGQGNPPSPLPSLSSEAGEAAPLHTRPLDGLVGVGSIPLAYIASARAFECDEPTVDPPVILGRGSVEDTGLAAAAEDAGHGSGTAPTVDTSAPTRSRSSSGSQPPHDNSPSLTLESPELATPLMKWDDHALPQTDLSAESDAIHMGLICADLARICGASAPSDDVSALEPLSRARRSAPSSSRRRPVASGLPRPARRRARSISKAPATRPSSSGRSLDAR